jgi:hypothetical protein
MSNAALDVYTGLLSRGREGMEIEFKPGEGALYLCRTKSDGRWLTTVLPEGKANVWWEKARKGHDYYEVEIYRLNIPASPIRSKRARYDIFDATETPGMHTKTEGPYR